MNLKELFAEDRAVSPVIGVILMVAITVILAAVIGTFVLGLGDQVSSTTPSASFSFDYTQDVSGANDSLDATHGGGDSLSSSQVNVSIAGAEVTNDLNPNTTDVNGQYTWSGLGGGSGDVTAGSSATVDRANLNSSLVGSNQIDSTASVELDGATIRVVWSGESGDNSAVLGSWSGPNA